MKILTAFAALDPRMITSGPDYGRHELAPQVRSVGKLLLALLLAVILGGCQGENAVVRYRVIANFDVDGKPFAASTVMEIRYSRVTQSLIGAGGATRLYGETLIADIPGKGTIYILPVEQHRDGSLGRVWENAILQTLGIKSSIGSLKDEDFERMRNTKGRMRFWMFSADRLPTFIAFRDEKDPKSIFKVPAGDIGKIYPGVRFRGLEVEITTDPVTSNLRDRLPWLNSRTQVFERDPPGKQRPASDSPIGFLITAAHFFGNGSM